MQWKELEEKLCGKSGTIDFYDNSHGDLLPSVSYCLSRTILQWIPCLVFCVITPIHVLKWKSRSSPVLKYSILFQFRLALTCFIFFNELTNLIFKIAVYNYFNTPVILFGPIWSLLVYVGISLVQIFDRKCGCRNNKTLTVYWTIAFVVGLLDTYSHISQSTKHDVNALHGDSIINAIRTSALFVAIILSSFIDKGFEEQFQSSSDCHNLWNRLTYEWFTPYIKLGLKSEITVDDLPPLPKAFATKKQYAKFARVWKNEVESKKSKPSLLKVILLKANALESLYNMMLKLLVDVLQYVSPLILEYLIGYVSSKEPKWKGILACCVLILALITRAMAHMEYLNQAFKIGLGIRGSLMNAIYEKTFRLTSHSKLTKSTGEIVNLMSVHAEKFYELSIVIHNLWSVPMTILVCIILLWQRLGPSSLMSLIVMIILIIINAIVMTYAQRLTDKGFHLKDKRITAITDILTGIKLIKLSAWEDAFEKNVNKTRLKEIDIIKKSQILLIACLAMFQLTPALTGLATLGVYIMLDSDAILSPQLVFVSFAIMEIMRVPLLHMSRVVTTVQFAQISAKRIEAFLMSPERDPISEYHMINNTDIALEVSNGQFCWSNDGKGFKLGPLSARIEEHKLIGIVGIIQSGKSSLLSAVLGEMHKERGVIKVTNNIAYVPQQAWISNGTIQDNILLKNEFDHKLYTETIESCALIQDLAEMTEGDMKEVNDRGSTLSGGQKQRINLGRACYSQADIFLLDDPLSAVDAHIARHIFDHVIGPYGILKNKARLFVTNSIVFLDQCDYIIVLDDGKIIEEGTYQNLIENDEHFAHYIKRFSLTEVEEKQYRIKPGEHLFKIPKYVKSRLYSKDACIKFISDEERMTILRKQEKFIRKSVKSVSDDKGAEAKPLFERSISTPAASQYRRDNDDVCIVELEEESDGEEYEDDPFLPNTHKNKSELATISASQTSLDNIDNVLSMNHTNQLNLNDYETKSQKQKSEHESVRAIAKNSKLKSYFKWIQKGGICTFSLFQAAFTIYVGLEVYSAMWLKEWTEDYELRIAKNATPSSNLRNEIRNDNIYRLMVFCIMKLGNLVFMFFRGALLLAISIKASKNLHQDLLRAILHAKQRFFDETKTGKITNTFSKDIEIIDHILGIITFFFFSMFYNAISVNCIIAFSIPIYGVLIIVLVIMYLMLQRYFIVTQRQLKALDLATRSPFCTQFQETLSGLSVIRAFKKQEHFINDLISKIDENTRVVYYSTVANRWLSIRLEFIGLCTVTFVSCWCVFNRENVDAGTAGLVINYSFQMTVILNILVMAFGDIESKVIAIDRLEEYTSVEQEDNKPFIENFKANGEIEFLNVQAKYQDNSDPVLKNISAIIKPGEKIGIVGQTGSGKSSLVSTLFRTLDVSSGNIFLNGREIKSIPVKQLRKNLTIIPQDPIIFAESLRYNIDPTNEYTDAELTKALQLSNISLWKTEDDEQLLNFKCKENGENLSQGQKQMIALGRAMLNKTNILVLDEATANLDLDTEEELQKSLSKVFADSTMLIIAHRIQTISNCDRIMVIENGKLKEFDTPNNLIERRGKYYDIAVESGAIA